MIQNTEHFKKILEKEEKLLESQLKDLGRINPENPKDWEAVPPESSANIAEKEELAEQTEAYERNTAVLKQLEIKYNEVKDAIIRIYNNTYGKCEVCANEIEGDRLEANPSAKTCKAHI